LGVIFNSSKDFQPQADIPPLLKEVGSAQHTDGVRIEEDYHEIFNPVDSPCYVARGNSRPIKVLFNNQVFDAEYRYEGQSDSTRHLERISFKKALKEEFKRVFPEAIGRFTIQAGRDLNHFVFNIDSNSTRYWVFQANPTHYKVIEALRDNVIKSWYVSKHKNEIKKGDKVILWVVGKNSGCYALATVASEIVKRKDDDIEAEYYANKEDNIETDRCGLSFDYFLLGNPILKESTKENPKLKNLKVGNAGTNFTATKEEYEELLRITFELTPEEEYQSQIYPVDHIPNIPPSIRNESAERKTSSIQRSRSPKEGAVALTRAGFKCEADSSHETFKTELGLWYMEKHHLIPMEAEKLYEKNIDHSYNIYSLCPNCHRKIHHGSSHEKKEIIEYLFRQRRKQYLETYEVDLERIMTHY